MKPETLRAWYSEGKYVALTDSHAFVFDPKSGDLRWLSGRWDTAVPDMQLDALMLAKGFELYQWQGGATTLPMIWRSKVFALPPGTRLGCARVISDVSSQCRFALIIDGVRVFSLTEGQVPAGVFRLPPLRGRRWQIEVAGSSVIERITLGSSIAEVAAQ